MSKCVITQEEAEEIIEQIPGSETMADQVKLQAMIGVMGVVQAMQDLGYRITKPLRVV